MLVFYLLQRWILQPEFCQDGVKRFSSSPHFSFLSPQHQLPRWLSGKEPACQEQETQEMWVRSLCWEDTLEEETVTPSSILAGIIPWTESLAGYMQSMGSQRVRHDWACKHTLNSQLLKYQMLPGSEPFKDSAEWLGLMFSLPPCLLVIWLS